MPDVALGQSYGVTTFCDDIRNEASGDVTIVGAKNGDFRLPTFPIVLPKFGVSCSIVCKPLSVGHHQVVTMVFLPGDGQKPSININGNINVSEEAAASYKSNDPDIPAHSKITTQFVLSPIELKHEGEIKVRALLDGELIRAGTIKVVRSDAVHFVVPTQG